MEIITYNITKSGVELVYKMWASYNVQRNNRRWSLVNKFFTMLNICGINGHVIFTENAT